MNIQSSTLVQQRLLCFDSRSKLNKATAHMLTLAVYNKSNTTNFSNISVVIDAGGQNISHEKLDQEEIQSATYRLILLIPGERL